MVGLNHEFARELLWREYPTDQRGSYFRQFWDVARIPQHVDDHPRRRCARSCATSRRSAPGAELRLGDARQAPAGGQPAEDEVVLSIRGELLKRYPNAVIYAHRAAWQTKAERHRSTSR